MIKLVTLWLSIVIVTSCSIKHYSDNFACTKSADCTALDLGDRVCSEGFCVIPNGATLDGPSTQHDAPGTTQHDAPSNLCPVGCSSCNPTEKSCTIECGAPGAANCGAPITCPTGWSCNIDCHDTGDCRSGINCTNSDACNITCSGAGACRNVACGSGPCDVKCTGQASCSRFMQCGASCKCDIECIDTSTETCAQSITCDGACFTPQGGCTSTPVGVCSTANCQ